MDQNSKQYRKIDGVHFLNLKGTTSEMMSQHSTLLKDNIPNGPLSYLALKNEWLIRLGPQLRFFPQFVSNGSVALYRNLLIPFLSRTLPKEYKEQIEILASTLQTSTSHVKRALYQADSMMWLSQIGLSKYRIKSSYFSSLPGCTSAIALEETTKNREILFARNLDYPIVGPWEREQTLLFMEGTEKGYIPHISFTAAGLHLSGITSMNREGIALSVHAHFAKKVNGNGLPIFLLGNQIISKAKTINEAIELAKKFPRIGNWAYLVASAKENRAVIIELGVEKVAVVESENGLLTHSNYFQTPSLREEEILVSGAVINDLTARKLRADEMLKPLKGEITEKHMAEVLGDSIDPYTQSERIYGSTIATPVTVHSIIMAPSTQKIWPSVRKESPTSFGPYLEVDLEKFWDKSENDIIENRRYLTPLRESDAPKVLAMSHYRKAYQASSTLYKKESVTLCYEEIKKAIIAFPSDGHLHIQAGLIAFKLKEFENSFNYFTEATKNKLSYQTHALATLFLGRNLDLQGKRSDALFYYKTYETPKIPLEPRLQEAFNRGIKSPYLSKRIGSLLLDLQFPDAHQY